MINLKRRPRSTGSTPAAPSATGMHDAEAASAQIETWTRRNELLTKAQRAALVVCLACAPLAPVGLAWNALHSPTATASTSTVASTYTDERGRVSLYGRDAVVAWLGATQGQEAQLSGWFPMANATLPQKAPQVSEPLLASADLVASHRWNVRIAVTVNGTREYLQVPLAYDPASSAISTLAMPQPVPGLLTGSPVDNPINQTVPLTSDLGHTLAGFVTALACGQGDITRYTSPGSTITAITPAPFTTVQLTNLAADVPIPLDRAPREGGTAQVLLGATATGKTTGTQTVSWTLTVRARAGRWEVASLDAVPGVRGTSPAAPAAATGSPAAAASPVSSGGSSAPTHK